MREEFVSETTSLSPILDPRIIRPPVDNSFLDVGAAELFIDRALEKRWQLSVRGKAQSNDLRIRQFRDARAQRLRQNGRETNTLFHTNHTVLKMGGPATQTGGKDEQGHGNQEQPGSADSGMTKQEIGNNENVDEQDRQHKKMKSRINLGMAGVRL